MLDHNTTEQVVLSWNRYFMATKDPETIGKHRWAAVAIRELVEESLAAHKADEPISVPLEELWQLILSLIQSASSRKILIAVAVGPLKQVLESSHFDLYIERVKRENICNARLTYCLSHISLHDEEHNQLVFGLGDRCACFSMDGDCPSEREYQRSRLVNAWLDFRRDKCNEESASWVIHEIYDRLASDDPNELWELVMALLNSATITTSEQFQVGDLLSELLEVGYTKYSKVIAEEVANDPKLARAVVTCTVDDSYTADWSAILTAAERVLKDQRP